MGLRVHDGTATDDAGARRAIRGDVSYIGPTITGLSPHNCVVFGVCCSSAVGWVHDGPAIPRVFIRSRERILVFQSIRLELTPSEVFALPEQPLQPAGDCWSRIHQAVGIGMLPYPLPAMGSGTSCIDGRNHG